MSRYKTKSVLISVDEPSCSSGMIGGVQFVAVSFSTSEDQGPTPKLVQRKASIVCVFFFVMHHKDGLDGLGLLGGVIPTLSLFFP